MTIQLRRDLAANWAAVNPILAQGEAGYELDTGNLKVGDGVLAWNALPYFSTPIGLHAATHENGGSDEISVAGLSGLLADPQTPIIGGGANDAVAGNDPRLSDARTPTAHAASHQNGGGDEISVAGLSGLLADPQTPLVHDIITLHNGFPGGGTTYLRDDGTFAVPPGTGAGITELTGDVTAGPGSGSQAATLAAALKVVEICFIIDGGGSALTTGQKGHVKIPFACAINQADLYADQSGSVVIDIWKDTYANFPPTGADTITAAAKPTLSGAQKYQDATLTGWTTAIAAGDILAYNVDSVATITRLTVSLKATRT